MTMANDTQKQSSLVAISPEKLKELINQNSVTLVDVREPAEHAGEHIAGSVLVPLSSFDPSQVPADPNKSTILYCRSGNRSAQAAQKLFAAGVKEVIHLDGGILAWTALNYPTVAKRNAPISLMRQVQITAGSLVLLGTLLGAFVSPWFLILSGFVGAGLIFAGVTDTCAMAMLLAKMPWNQNV